MVIDLSSLFRSYNIIQLPNPIIFVLIERKSLIEDHALNPKPLHRHDSLEQEDNRPCIDAIRKALILPNPSENRSG